MLSVLPMPTGPCTVASLPGEHLFQANALPRNRMRPATFHAFGKAKIGAQAALRELEQQGWETLPMATLGVPNLPPAWTVETWKPVGGCKCTGWGNWKQCTALLPVSKVASNSKASDQALSGAKAEGQPWLSSCRGRWRPSTGQ